MDGFNFELHHEIVKTDYHQVQLNKLYDSFIKELLDEIEGKSNSSIANEILHFVRNRDKYTNDEIIEKFRNDEYVDYSPWFTDDYPYKLFILLSYYDWREYFKLNRMLINYTSGKNLDEDLIKD